jgi:hypothetical protein
MRGCLNVGQRRHVNLPLNPGLRNLIIRVIEAHKAEPVHFDAPPGHEEIMRVMNTLPRIITV